MLVLKRPVGSRVRIETPGGDIWITLIDTERGAARLGIDAPREYVIARDELLRHGKAQEKAAGDGVADGGTSGEPPHGG